MGKIPGPPAHDLAERIHMSPQAMRSLGYRVVDLLVEHWTHLEEKPVTRVAERAYLETRLREPPPEHPSNIDEVLETVERDVFGNIMLTNHPRFFAFIPGPSNFVGVMADALAAGFNGINALWIESSGTSALELVVVDWLRVLCGFPQTAGGLFVSGGSVANLTALAVAREVKLENRVEGATVYCSDQVHGSLRKALKVLGFTPQQLQRIPVNADFEVDLEALTGQIAVDKESGLSPFCVIANAGTTNTGAVDPLDRLADLCDQQSLWLHVDGAYGAAAVLTQEGKTLLAGLERADSIAIDPHKWLFQPFEAGVVLVRQARWLKNTFGARHEYMRDSEMLDTEQVNFCDYGIQLTRAVRALKLWMTIKVFGLENMRKAIQRGMDYARRVQAMLERAGCFEVISPARLGIVVFRYATQDPARSDKVNSAIVAACIEEGFTFPSSTELKGRTVLRMCTINPRTTVEDLQATVDALKALGSKLEQAQSD